MNELLIVAITFAAVFLLVLVGTVIAGNSSRKGAREVRERLHGLAMAAERGRDPEQIDLLRKELEGVVPLADRWLHNIGALAGIRLLLTQSRVEWTPADLFLRCTGAAVVGAGLAYWRTNAVVFAVVIGAITAMLPLAYVLSRRSKRLDEIERQLPQALDLIVRALRAGHGLLAGIEMVAKESPDPIGAEFTTVFDEQNYGLELREALHNLSERAPIQDIHIVVTAILIQRETGGNLAEVLSNVASVIRDRYRLKRQIKVHTAQGRLTGWVLAGLPVILGSAIFMARPDFIAILWQNETGLKLLWGACILTLFGALVINRIIRIRV